MLEGRILEGKEPEQINISGRSEICIGKHLMEREQMLLAGIQCTNILAVYVIDPTLNILTSIHER